MPRNLKGTWTLTARWVFPVSGPPVEWGIIAVRGERIVAVDPRSSRTADFNLGNAAVVPGFVNAHTHLDLSGLRGKAPPAQDFTAWLRAVIDHRRGRSLQQVEADVRDGLAECLSFGTTLLGDISGQGMSWAILSAGPARVVVFYELLGLPQARAAAAWSAATIWLETHQPTATCRPGLSPHAPYSVRTSLVVEARDLARRLHLPLAIHLAETPAEIALLQSRRGPFVPFLTELGVWDADGLAKSIDHVITLCESASPALFIHGNYLADSSKLPANGTIVYCPRTHAAFGHAPHPFPKLLARGTRIALGTDSLASNPDLNVFAEIQYVHQLYPDVAGDTLLRMATLSGAEALDWETETGSLAPGKSADLVVLRLPDQDVLDPYELLLASSSTVEAVLCRGKWVYSAQGYRLPAVD